MLLLLSRKTMGIPVDVPKTNVDYNTCWCICKIGMINLIILLENLLCHSSKQSKSEIN